MTISALLFCLAALGTLAMGVKYIASAVPAPYHASILGGEATALPDNLVAVLTAIYRSFGGAVIGLGVAMLCLAIWPIAEGNEPAAFGAFLAGSVAAISATLAPRSLEQKTGVRTPWRVAAALELVLVGALLAFFIWP
jgi:hypothetical protein